MERITEKVFKVGRYAALVIPLAGCGVQHAGSETQQQITTSSVSSHTSSSERIISVVNAPGGRGSINSPISSTPLSDKIQCGRPDGKGGVIDPHNVYRVIVRQVDEKDAQGQSHLRNYTFSGPEHSLVNFCK